MDSKSLLGEPLVSIIINNYNYAQYLGIAIESALEQTYLNIEVVVVDDGSSDNSKEIIQKYGDKIVPIFKPNGGQNSAGNAGFAASKGDIICFLDADDIFYPTKVEKMVSFMTPQLEQNFYVMAYHQLDVINTDGHKLDRIEPRTIDDTLPPNLYTYAQKYKFLPYVSSPTSGLCVSRPLADKIFPLPDDANYALDDFIARPASLIGEIHSLKTSLGGYRLHGNNNWNGNPYLRDKAFMITLETFLNEKLVSDGKEPVISFFDSLYAREYYAHSGNSRALIALAFRVIQHTCDLKTLRFFLKTLLIAAPNAMR